MSDILFTQKYPMSEIGSMSTLGRRGGGHLLPPLHLDAGATNVVQRGYRRAKYGKKPKQNARLALRLIQAGQSEAIQRYQRIGTYEGFTASLNGPGSLDLGHYTAGASIGSAGTFQLNYYPVHIFDVTSNNYYTPGGYPTSTGTPAPGTWPGRKVTAPCQWRLVSFDSAPSGYTVTPGDFFWYPFDGQNRLGSRVGPEDHWRVERNMNTVFTNSSNATLGVQTTAEPIEPFFADKCYLDWADVRMCLYGARAQTTKFTVSLIQMNDRTFDVREIPPYTGAIQPAFNATWYQSQRDRSTQNNFNAAMQEMVHPLVFHPLSSAGATAIKPFKTLMKRSYIIGPDTDVNTDDSQPNLLVKFFHRLNRICKYGWDDTPTLGNDVTVDAPNYNLFYNPQVKGYAHPKAKLYIMVTAQAYTKVSVSPEGVPGNTDTCPAMDIIIRRKIDYEHVTRPGAQNPVGEP